MKISKNDLLKCFKETLKTDDVTLDDSFFDLGGDSFDVIRLLYKLKLDIRVIDVFNNPSVNRLFEVIESNVEDNDYLIKLNDLYMDNRVKAVVVIPYGGGDVSIYKDFSDSFLDIPVYGLDTNKIVTTNDEEFIKSVRIIAEQITSMGFKEILMYGHCAGSALALYLTKLLNSKVKVNLFLAASVPISSPDNSLIEFNKTTNSEWENYLNKIGGLNGLNSDEISEMLEKGRRDHLISILSFRCIPRDIYKPEATLIFGTNDPVTSNVEKIIQEWDKYIKISKISKIHNAGHYFIKKYPDEVAEVLKNKK